MPGPEDMSHMPQGRSGEESGAYAHGARRLSDSKHAPDFQHEQFEILASLAAIGDLDPQELAEFTAHLPECPECQRSYRDFAELASDHVPLARSHSQRVDASALETVRSGALARIAAEGFRLTPEAMHGPASWSSWVARRAHDLRWLVFTRRFEVVVSGFALATVAAIALAARYDAAQKSQIETLRAQVERTHQQSSQQATDRDTTTAEIKPLAVVPSNNSGDVERLERELADAGARALRLETERTRESISIASLQATVDRLTSENQVLLQRAGSSDEQAATLRGQLDEVRLSLGAAREQLREQHNSADSRETQLTAARRQVGELSDELKAQQAALDQERQLLAAGRDVRDLMAARNLHIIDVHDVDARGESRPFGRIFLTEGKRLIFYAYDLDTLKTRNTSFQAWGQRSGNTRAAVNLGILFVDDQKQSRWALKVEDADLLEAIDAVFVTVEPNSGNSKPTGRRLMYAYLRNPINHP